ncbi:unknow (plasmid) [Vibrio campbellii]|jgi:hypothetical protein|nr:unknow [Vibrio campbellii]
MYCNQLGCEVVELNVQVDGGIEKQNSLKAI